MSHKRILSGVFGLLLMIVLSAGCSADPYPSGTNGGMVFENHSNPPVLAPGGGHLLGMRDGVLVLCAFPELRVLHRFEPGDGALVTDFAWAPDGMEFAYRVNMNGRGDVFVADLQGNTWVVGAAAPLWYGEVLEWSADGRYLLWDQPLTVWIRDTGELVVPELDAEDSVRSPLFAPDGRRVFFTRFGVDNTENLWVLELHDGSLYPVTDADDGDYPLHWLAANRLLVHAGKVSFGGGSVYGLAVVDVGSGERKVVAAEPGRLIQAVSVSPDGRRAVGRLLNSVQPDVGVILLDLQNFSWETVLTHHFPWDVWWLDGREALLTAATRVGDRGTREYRIYRLREDNDPVLLVASKNELRILGAQKGTLHYLEGVEKEPAVWVWVCRSLRM